jgi:4a-hydroxytetrahydrobiopterin dehydratase
MNSLAEMNVNQEQEEKQILSEEEITEFKQEVPDWQIVDLNGTKRMKREFKFEDFAKALDFTNRVGEIAEEQNHHPVLMTEWGKVTVTWWTHEVEGLHKNDFVMAAKTSRLYEPE